MKIIYNSYDNKQFLLILKKLLSKLTVNSECSDACVAGFNVDKSERNKIACKIARRIHCTREVIQIEFNASISKVYTVMIIFFCLSSLFQRFYCMIMINLLLSYFIYQSNYFLFLTIISLTIIAPHLFLTLFSRFPFLPLIFPYLVMAFLIK